MKNSTRDEVDDKILDTLIKWIEEEKRKGAAYKNYWEELDSLNDPENQEPEPTELDIEIDDDNGYEINDYEMVVDDEDGRRDFSNHNFDI